MRVMSEDELPKMISNPTMFSSGAALVRYFRHLQRILVIYDLAASSFFMLVCSLMVIS